MMISGIHISTVICLLAMIGYIEADLNYSSGLQACLCNTSQSADSATADAVCSWNTSVCSNALCFDAAGPHSWYLQANMSNYHTNCYGVNNCALPVGDCKLVATCEMSNQTGIKCRCSGGTVLNGSSCCSQGKCYLIQIAYFSECNVTNHGNTGESESNATICTDQNTCNPVASCSADATCNNTIGSYQCNCNNGYTGNGQVCVDLNECLTDKNSCDLNATCHNLPGNFSCACDKGFTGNGTFCDDINECSSLVTCDSNGSCRNTKGSFLCSCNEGFTGNGTFCDDFNECLTDEDLCDSNATCHNLPGSFSCTCDKGFTGNGTFCKDINECSSLVACDSNGSCRNTKGSFSCSCNEGFTGNGSFCFDVDECSTENSNICPSNSSCTNTFGSYTCVCDRGFTGNTTYCSDINECDQSGAKLCHEQATCRNSIGSFFCMCNSGYIANGEVCVDLNECLTGEDSCDSNATCHNLPGNFSCTCNKGFTGNGTFCDDINECSSTGACSSNGFCQNTKGSFLCSCNEGYTGNGTYCVDVDECSSTKSTPCNKNAKCANSVGHYTCKCNKGFTGNGLDCYDLDECALGTSNCHQSHAICTNQIGTFSCSCNHGYTGNGVECKVIDQCKNTAHDCDRNAKCISSGVDFSCTCNTGFGGDGKTCHRTFILEMRQNFTSSALPQSNLTNRLQTMLYNAFHFQIKDVTRVSITDLDQSVAKYRVHYINGPQQSALFIESYRRYAEHNEIILLKNLPRRSPCTGKALGGFTFPEVSINQVGYSNEVCPRGHSRASIRCVPIQISETNGERQTSRFDLKSLASVNCEEQIKDIKINVTSPSQDAVERAATYLQIITSGLTPLTNEEVKQSFDVVTSISKAVGSGAIAVSQDMLANVVTATSHVTQSIQTQNRNNASSSPPTQTEAANARKVVESLTLLAHKTELDNSTEPVLEVTTELFSLKVAEQDKDEEPQGEWFAPAQEVLEEGEIVFPVNISLPSTAFKAAFKASNTSKLRAVFLTQKGDDFFPTDEEVDYVVTAEIGINISLTNLDPPVLIENPYEETHYGEVVGTDGLQLVRIKHKCVYWDSEIANWKSDGCGLDPNSDSPSCKCNHLTNFALIVSRVKLPADVALSYVSKIGCGISLVGFCFTVILHALNKELLKKLPNKIQLHVYCNMFIAYFLFLVGISSTGNPAACTAIAALMQFTFLSSWLWMAVYSNRLYGALVKVFHADATNYMVKACIFAYGVPTFIVVINLIVTVGHLDKQQINSDFYDPTDSAVFFSSTYRAEHMCWLTGNSLYFGFLLIIGLVFINNLIILALVLRKIIFRRQEIQSTAAKQSSTKQLVMALSLALTLGLTWVFGFLMLFSTDITYNQVLGWLFALFNVFQGVATFYITCVKRDDMFRFWWIPVRSWVRSTRVYDHVFKHGQYEFNSVKSHATMTTDNSAYATSKT